MFEKQQSQECGEPLQWTFLVGSRAQQCWNFLQNELFSFIPMFDIQYPITHNRTWCREILNTTAINILTKTDRSLFVYSPNTESFKNVSIPIIQHVHMKMICMLLFCQRIITKTEQQIFFSLRLINQSGFHTHFGTDQNRNKKTKKKNQK